jgi:hypothetical protein
MRVQRQFVAGVIDFTGNDLRTRGQVSESFGGVKPGPFENGIPASEAFDYRAKQIKKK